MDRVLCALIYLITALSGFSGKQEKWEPGKKLKVLLVGYNGARNTGSDVRVTAIARQVKALFGADKVHIREKIQAALPGYQKKLNDMGIFMREYIQTALRMS